MSADVRLERRDGILLVTLDRAERKNALTAAMLDELLATFRALSDDAETRVVVVRGEGADFCSGLDLADMEAAKAADGTVGLTAIESVFDALEHAPQPTIAAVDGAAIAGGCELALHCDLRVATSRARFAMPLAKLGLVIPYPLIAKLVETAGRARTADILFTGRAIRGEEALDWGIVSRLVSADELDAQALELASEIAANAPLALRAMKKTLLRVTSVIDGVDTRDLVEEMERVAASDDVREGIRAMRERRAPRFQGR